MTAPALPSIPAPTDQKALLSLHDKCAMVTGGSRGLGEAIVHRLTAAGAAVLFTGRGEDALRTVHGRVTAGGADAVGVAADIANLDDSRRIVDLAVQRFGGVDILVNNAALYTPSLALDTSEELFDSVVDADLKGAFFLAQYAAKAMIAAGGGSSTCCRWMHFARWGCWRPTHRPRPDCGRPPRISPKSLHRIRSWSTP